MKTSNTVVVIPNVGKFLRTTVISQWNEEYVVGYKSLAAPHDSGMVASRFKAATLFSISAGWLAIFLTIS